MAIGGQLNGIEDSPDNGKRKVILLEITQEQRNRIPEVYDRSAVVNYHATIDARKELLDRIKGRKAENG